jgi:hypothetical protein
MTDLIKVETITDHEDGTATVTLNLSPKPTKKYLNMVSLSLLKKE